MLRPVLSQTRVPLIDAIEAIDERGRRVALSIPLERPLSIYVDKREIVTLMTLGAAPEALVLGYLRNQQLIHELADIESVQVDWEVDAAAVTTRCGVDATQCERRVVTTGCGQGTVFAEALETVAPLDVGAAQGYSQGTLFEIIDAVRRHPSIYKQAGSVHACALFDQRGALIYFLEDVGRHNAVDAIAGFMWLDGIDGSNKVFYTTGRLTSEMVVKAAQMRIPVLMSRSGTTAMGLQMAKDLNVTLLTRCTGRHFLLLCGEDRIAFDVEHHGAE